MNGRAIRDERAWVELPTDAITLDDVPATPAERRYFALHKPKGFVTTRSDEHGRRTVYDLLPADANDRWIFPVGRLDRDSEGLLLFTDDGPWADRLTDPNHHVEKEYWVEATPAVDEARLDRLRAGVVLDGGEPTRPARVTARPDGYEVILEEGRNRQVRRMFEAVGSRVTRLVRVRIGGLPLGALPPGQGRWLTPAEASRAAPVRPSRGR